MKPILFSTDMVRAILRGDKMQTRRVMKPQNIFSCEGPYRFDIEDQILVCGRCRRWAAKMDGRTAFAPPHAPGDILWVREAWTMEASEYFYRADFDRDYLDPCKTLSGGYPSECRLYLGCEGCNRGEQRIVWKPPIHMPREAARIFLRVTDVRAERLRDISEEDAIAEGCSGEIKGTVATKPIEEYRALWDSLNAKRGYGWDVNPWCWVYSFERIAKETAC